MITESGICFPSTETKPLPSIEFFDFATRRTTRIALITEGVRDELLSRWMSVSPDGKWLVYANGSINADIMMIEHFR